MKSSYEKKTVPGDANACISILKKTVNINKTSGERGKPIRPFCNKLPKSGKTHHCHRELLQRSYENAELLDMTHTVQKN